MTAPFLWTLRSAEAVGTHGENGEDEEGAAAMVNRAHGAMLLQADGRANAPRAPVKAMQEHGPDFPRLANALSALCPCGGAENRLLDAMLLVVPR